MIELLILLLGIAPGIYLILRESPRAIDYYIVVFTLNRCGRRLVDYYVNGGFNESSLISLMPKVLALAFILPVILQPPAFPKPIRNALALAGAAMALGCIVGLKNGPAGVIISAIDFASPICALLYVLTIRAEAPEMRSWIRTILACATFTAIYCIYQFAVAIPKWDEMWLLESKMATEIKLYGVRAFGPMSDGGIAALFLSLAAGCALFSGRLWNPANLGLLALFLTAVLMIRVRTAWLVLLATPIIFGIISGAGISKGMLRALLVIAAGYFLIPFLPGGNAIVERMSSFHNISADGSFTGRSEFYVNVGLGFLTNPFGGGLGSTGLAARYAEGGIGAFESGFLDYFYTFGLLGGLLWYAAFFQIGRFIVQMRRHIFRDDAPEFHRIALALFLGQCLTMASGNILKGEFAVILFVFLGLALRVPELTLRGWANRHQLRRELQPS